MSEPFSRVFRVDALRPEGETVALEASAAEREALASFYKLPSIEALTASLTLKRSSAGGVRVTGAVHGRLTQVCVVSLEPFPATVEEDVDVRFAPRAQDEEPRTYSIADEDEPDPIVDGKIDLGALVAEFLALGLDPYPRKPGATFESPKVGSDNVSPFSSLGALPGRKAD